MCIYAERADNMKAIRKPFTYKLQIIKVAAKGLRNTKFYTTLLVLVMIAGIFSLSPTIPSLMKDVTASLMNNVPPSSANITMGSNGTISIAKVTARSGSPEDIQAAVDAVAAAGGGTVYVPEGDWEFNHLSMHGVDIIGGVNVIGAGKDVTILRQTQLREPSTASMSMFFVDGTNERQTRISGFTFIGYINDEDPENILYSIKAVIFYKCKDFRLDHCKFIDFNHFSVYTSCYTSVPHGYNRGVIDHCDIDCPYKDRATVWTTWSYGIGVNGPGREDTWNEDINFYLGKYEESQWVVYIEDCTFSRCRHAIAGGAGAWYVVRHCKFTEPRPKNFGVIDVHGGGRGLEAYDNLIIGAADYPGSQAFWIRGGGGTIFNNTIQGCGYGVMLSADPGIQEKYKVKDMYIWNNTQDGGTPLTTGDYIENVDYFLYEKPGYVPYPYPHPLALETTP